MALNMRVSVYQCEGKLAFYTECDPCLLLFFAQKVEWLSSPFYALLEDDGGTLGVAGTLVFPRPRLVECRQLTADVLVEQVHVDLHGTAAQVRLER
jgi:hypothetical protein